jgi:serine phosphatase RsbU (regulator of sigma subunit)
MLEGTSEGILFERPSTTTIVLWFIGLLSIVSSSIIYGNVTEKISVEQTRLETEVRIAQDIQSQLVPLVDICDERYELFGKTTSAYQIGGDFFEALNLSDQKIVLAVGDVSGHNIAAGLLMAITKGAFRTALQHTSSLVELVESMNRTILENSDKKMFVSFKCCEIDLVMNSMTVVNAGHLPLIHYKSKNASVLEYNQYGLALGLSNKATYEAQQLFFDKGDLFLLLTDGIVEAANASTEQFGFNRIKNLIEQLAIECGPKRINEKLMSELKDFTDSRPLNDDVTFVAIKIAQK